MKYTVALFVLWQIIACNKEELLKENPTTAIIVPTTPGDMQALLDNEEVFASTTSLNFICADEFYFTDAAFPGMKQSITNAYKYADFSFDQEEEVPDWNNAYTQAFYANNVLKGVDRLRGSIDDKLLAPLAGDALFKRAFAFFNAAQVFTLPYDSLTAGDYPGIPLRLTIDRDEALPRGTVKAVYDRVLEDLTNAIDLLPAGIDPVHRNRSNRPAAYALRARVYLSMGAYKEALDDASGSLALFDTLIDFNTGLYMPNLPFATTNIETLYQSRMAGDGDVLYDAMVKRQALVDSGLLAEYSPGDLRRTVFFTRLSPASFKASYYGKLHPFTGMGISELYLIAAECNARLGDVNTGLDLLNKLLKSRWKTGQYIPYTAATPEEALQIILLERRKELVFRGIRWTDIRRLNKKGPLLTLKHKVQENSYELFPNSGKYALPIPEQVIRFNKLMYQNERR
ncbi:MULTISPECIES: RagB/SusD family nutrient uptake outer membrane protein [Niastella]|uniref:RagB/SusD family nutrient uptake outer membrane protein n=1 Tax=Niastella soli TaxID=2821487 RepID=A0ABS3Z3S4_9BACT|nr:RagB/SusD family nutrient uptake outer membrane protein [Niastella soli]MBO9204688.1 RagB/SusD family nutrient uptake outer membrane protein [Niastella soli]